MTAPDTALPPNKLAYSIEEACAAVSLGTTKLYELIGEGKISAKAEGRRTLIPRESLLSYLSSLPAWTPKMRPTPRRHRAGDRP
jgi:excisionase family DNA binding protein